MNTQQLLIRGMVAEGGAELTAQFEKHLEEFRKSEEDVKAEGDTSHGGWLLAMAYFANGLEQ